MNHTLAAAVLLAALSARAQVPIDQVAVVEKLGERIPSHLLFTDSTGKKVELASLLGADHRPILLTLVYYRCPALCGLVLNGLTGSLKETGFRPGDDYAAITVSIDPTDTPDDSAQKKRGLLQSLGYPDRAETWSFLTGDADSIHALADSLGFQYAYDDQLKQYAHAAVSFVLTPEGKISRYLYGLSTPPRDLRLALVEAAGGRVGTAFDRLLLTCYQYDASSRRYEPYVKGFLRGGALLVFFGLAGLLGVLWRKERTRRHSP